MSHTTEWHDSKGPGASQSPWLLPTFTQRGARDSVCPRRGALSRCFLSTPLPAPSSQPPTRETCSAPFNRRVWAASPSAPAPRPGRAGSKQAAAFSMGRALGLVPRGSAPRGWVPAKGPDRRSPLSLWAQERRRTRGGSEDTDLGVTRRPALLGTGRLSPAHSPGWSRVAGGGQADGGHDGTAHPAWGSRPLVTLLTVTRAPR